MTIPLPGGPLRDNVLQQKFDALAQAVPTVGAGPFVTTSLPTTAVNGQQIDYVADATNGVVWRFRYRSASASSFKWEFVGGSPLISEVANQETLAGAYAALGTAGPIVTLPLAGDYEISIGADINVNVGAGIAYMSYKIGATTAADADSIHAAVTIAGGATECSYARTMRKTGLTAVALTANYKTTGTGAFWQRRFMTVTPVRVG